MMPRSPSRFAAYFSLAAVIGCGASVTATTSATGTEGTSGGGASGGTTGDAGGGGAGGMAGASGVGCRKCACETPMSAGGCEDFCTGGANPPPEAFFCDGPGIPPFSQCAACMAMHCGVTDWTQCN